MSETPIPQRVRTWTCGHCGHEWIPRKPSRPVECPRCRRRTALIPKPEVRDGKP